jgi:Uma2 family endonuclease
MTTQLLTPPQTERTLADLWEQLGQVSLRRILLNPFPGTATEEDQRTLLNRNGVLCELVDGALVVKPMSLYESVVALFIVQMMSPYMAKHNPGILSGADGPFRLARGLVRLPDVCFVSWDQIPDRANWSKSMNELHPDLAIEILSRGNTRKEMERKLKEYFKSGAKLVWYINPADRSAITYTAPDQPTTHGEDQPLDAAPVLPGFALSLKELFDHVGNPPADD